MKPSLQIRRRRLQAAAQSAYPSISGIINIIMLHTSHILDSKRGNHGGTTQYQAWSSRFLHLCVSPVASQP